MTCSRKHKKAVWIEEKIDIINPLNAMKAEVRVGGLGADGATALEKAKEAVSTLTW